MNWFRALLTIVAGASALAIGAAAAGSPPLDANGASAKNAEISEKIRYIFVLYQENRSFDSYFGTFPGADGLYAHPPAQVPGFTQPIVNTDGTTSTITPFRIGPREFAADTDDVDHSHAGTLAKMHVVDGVPQMDQFALAEERKHTPSGDPTLAAKQFGELTMAHEDCDTVPFLWLYAKRFALYDRIFESMAGPSTPGNLTIIAAQSGVTQWLLHPDQAVEGNGERGSGVPVMNDADPFWGSPDDHSANPMPVNARDFPGATVQRNLTFASLPLTLQGRSIAAVARSDADPEGDLTDVRDDIAALSQSGISPGAGWGWYEEGFDDERYSDADGPVDAAGRHAAYITHHNGPQYFGYISNNPAMRAHLHGLSDFFNDVAQRRLSSGVYYVKGGFRNTLGMTPADPDAAVQKNFLGDDDHPAYSDAQISEAMIARIVNVIARSPYWKQSAIVITWDDAEGDYDHVPPPLRYALPGEAWVSDGPRIPLILISPYARTGAVVHEYGDQASVVKLVDEVFGLTPLASLPDESRARALGLERYGVDSLGPLDDPANALTDLSTGFDQGRLTGLTPALPGSYAEIPDSIVGALPERSGYGCKSIGIVPTDAALGIVNSIPADFNPRPKTDP
jgi:phospholipase C